MKQESIKQDVAQPRMVPLKVWAADRSISLMTAYRAAWSGQIPGAVKIRSQWRVPADANTTA